MIKKPLKIATKRLRENAFATEMRTGASDISEVKNAAALKESREIWAK
jgi:hypothetical protein